MNIILLGPPGAGKGTQGAILEKEFNLEKISTGDLVRSEIARESNLGLSIKKIVESGSYPSDEIIMNIVENKLNQYSQSSRIFDGVPRTIAQTKVLEKLLQNIEQKVDKVIFINISEKDLVERITTRYSCAKCGHIYNKFVTTKISGECNYCKSHDFTYRADDNLETLHNRLKIYNDLTKPLIEYYQEKGIFHVISGLEEVTDVSQQIREILNPLLFVESTFVKEG